MAYVFVVVFVCACRMGDISGEGQFCGCLSCVLCACVSCALLNVS